MQYTKTFGKSKSCAHVNKLAPNIVIKACASALNQLTTIQGFRHRCALEGQ